MQVNPSLVQVDEHDDGMVALVSLGNALSVAIVRNFLAAKELDAAFQAFNAARGVTS